MNIIFLALEGQACMQNWSRHACSLYNLLIKKHSVKWIGKYQNKEVEKYHKTIHEVDMSFNQADYTLLLGKLLSDVINQACYDLVICDNDIPYKYIVTDTLVISLDDYEKWTEDHIEQELAKTFQNINLYIPVYAINMKEREDRRQSIINEFEMKPEFELHLVEACTHRKGTIGLWNSMVKIVQMAKDNNEEFVIICEDDHFFTENYSPKLLIREIQEAFLQNAEVLSGGIGGFGYGFRTGFRRYWVDWFWCTQFIVVYASFYDKILSYKFKEDDAADEVISALAINKMVIYPFISEQKDFGYSDVTESNDENKGLIRKIFEETNTRFKRLNEQSFNKRLN